MSKPAEKTKLSSNAIGLEHKKVYYEKLRRLPLSQYLVVTTAMSNEVILQTKNLYNSHVLQPRAAQCIDKEILISKNGNIDIDIEIDKRMF